MNPENTTQTAPVILNDKQAADLLQISPNTLLMLRNRRVIPFIRLSTRIVRYDRDAVLAAARRFTVESRSALR